MNLRLSDLEHVRLLATGVDRDVALLFPHEVMQWTMRRGSAWTKLHIVVPGHPTVTLCGRVTGAVGRRRRECLTNPLPEGLCALCLERL